MLAFSVRLVYALKRLAWLALLKLALYFTIPTVCCTAMAWLKIAYYLFPLLPTQFSSKFTVQLQPFNKNHQISSDILCSTYILLHGYASIDFSFLVTLAFKYNHI